jgi:hypothetical protein
MNEEEDEGSDSRARNAAAAAAAMARWGQSRQGRLSDDFDDGDKKTSAR